EGPARLQEPGGGPRGRRRRAAEEHDPGGAGLRRHQAPGRERVHHEEGRRPRSLRPHEARGSRSADQAGRGAEDPAPERRPPGRGLRPHGRVEARGGLQGSRARRPAERRPERRQSARPRPHHEAARAEAAGGALMRTITIVVVLAALAVFSFWPHTTGPTEVGVRTVKWSPITPKGVIDEVYAPGATYFFPAVLSDWHTFDTKLQNIEMTFDPTRGDRQHRDDLLFKTVDGNDISLDVIVSYRIDPTKAPIIVQYVATSDFELRDKVVRTIARSHP